ncbi:uricase-like [Tubulanus polymorphus]|uniref:uricase-like n=1 Tax=Tubulanus polymorphus TaxID=672921 RepID=UPI003DA39CA9
MEIVDRGYGKNNVRLFHVRREGNVHYIKDVEVNTRLTLSTIKDFVDGDNRDIIATDSQKNTVYVLAKEHGVRCIEIFAMQLTKHFLNKYPHVSKAEISIDQYNWRRIVENGKEHNHAFIASPESIRFCKVEQERYGPPRITSGVKGLKVMKTTQSAFVDFVDDEFRTLPDMDDRIFCTVVSSHWKYNRSTGVDFCKTWHKVKGEILDTFAGPADTGVFSPSVQQTLYLTEKRVLEKIPEIESMDIELPNVHHYEADFSKFKRLNITRNDEVFIPTDKPSGNIQATMARKPASKL